MKNRLLLGLAVIFFCCHTGQICLAQTEDVEAKLNALIKRVMEDVKAGKRTEHDHEANIKDFDDLLARHKGEKTEAMAQVLYMKSRLYTEIFFNESKAAEIMKQVQADYPETKFGKMAAQLLARPDIEVKMENLQTRIMADMSAGKKTEADQAEHLKEFDALLAQHKNDTNDTPAYILYVKAKLYAEALKRYDKAIEIMKQVQRDYPTTKFARAAAEEFQKMGEQEKCQKIHDALAPGTPCPNFAEKDLDGKPLSIASRKGKVLLLDFWATWCPPCRGELPYVLHAYEKYHDQGFEIIGISLDDDKEALAKFLKQNKMTWPQYAAGRGPENKLAMQFCASTIPFTILIDREGKVIGQSYRGSELEEQVAKAIAKK